MTITIDLPEDIAAALEKRWGDVPRRCLEAVAVEAYRTGALNESQIRRLLGFETRFQVHALLKERQVALRYTEADVEEELSAHRQLGILPETAPTISEETSLASRLDELRRKGLVSSPASEANGDLKKLEEKPGALRRFLNSRE